MNRKLPYAFYRRHNVVEVARSLLGQNLMSREDGVVTGGMVVETEAYGGVTDRASHAFGGRRTARTETMYRAGGVAYIYLCYGMHALFNVVTHEEGTPHAVLIRAIEPNTGLELIKERRRMRGMNRRLTAGPGILTQALGIGVREDGADLRGQRVWVEKGPDVPDRLVQCSKRVGVDYAGSDALRPWRFRIRGNRWTSPAK